MGTWKQQCAWPLKQVMNSPSLMIVVVACIHVKPKNVRKVILKIRNYNFKV
jgi:hypothetical protein